MLGLRIGPPALMLYAVDPLGVEMIMPSPRKRTPGSFFRADQQFDHPERGAGG